MPIALSCIVSFVVSVGLGCLFVFQLGVGIAGFWFGLSVGQGVLLCLLGFVHANTQVIVKYEVVR